MGRVRSLGRASGVVAVFSVFASAWAGAASPPGQPTPSAPPVAPPQPSAPLRPVQSLQPGQPGLPGQPAQPAQPATEETWRQFRGQVLFSDVLFAPSTQFPTPASRIASLRRTGRSEIIGRAGFWRLHCVAFLDPVPTAGALMLRATDVTEPKQPTEVRVFEVAGEAGTKELSVGDLVLTDAMGFEAGHRYTIEVERGGDEPGMAATGKRDVYAKGVVTLR